MADKDNDSSRVLNELSNIKASLTSTNPMTINAVRSKLENIKRDNPNLAAEIANFIESIKQELSKLEERNALIARAAEAQDAIAQQDPEEIKQIVEHQHRLHETRALQQEYDSFKDDFVKKLQDDNALLKKAVNGEELTEDEKARLTRTPRNETERLEFEKSDKETAERWKKHYQLKDNYGKLIEHSENKIKKHQEHLKENSHPPRKVEEINSLIGAEEKQIAQHKENLQKLAPTELKREENRKTLLDGVRKGVDPKLLEIRLQKHYKAHSEKYEKALKEDPNHQGALEFREILEKIGINKELGSNTITTNPKITDKLTLASIPSSLSNQEKIESANLSDTDMQAINQNKKLHSYTDRYSEKVVILVENMKGRLLKPNPKATRNPDNAKALDVGQVKQQNLSESKSNTNNQKMSQLDLNGLGAEIRQLSTHPKSSLPVPNTSKLNNHRNNSLGR